MNASGRNVIYVEDAEVASHTACAGDQYVLRLRAPKCAGQARPGAFAHIQCDPALPMRRPLSIMRASRAEGWVEFLYKTVGQGTRMLSQRRVGAKVNLMGPIGRPFQPNPDRRRPLLLGGGVGIPPMVFLAENLRWQDDVQPFVVMGSEVPFPFTPVPSRFVVAGLPDGAIAGMPLMEDWAIPSRLASLRGYAGCFAGYVTDLARHWLETLSDREREQVEIFACGPQPMLEAVARLAGDYKLPCQVSLEEFMACAVGGCAGCTVLIRTEHGPAMKRVCVDGPVFDAADVFPVPA